MEGIIIKDTDVITRIDNLPVIRIDEIDGIGIIELLNKQQVRIEVEKLPSDIHRVIESVTGLYNVTPVIGYDDLFVIHQAPVSDNFDNINRLIVDAKFKNSSKLNFIGTFLIKVRDVIGNCILIRKGGTINVKQLAEEVIPSCKIEYKSEKTIYVPSKEETKISSRDDRMKYVDKVIDHLVSNKYISRDTATVISHWATKRYVISGYNFEMNFDSPNFDATPQHIHIDLSIGSVPSPEEIRYKKEKAKSYNQNQVKNGSNVRLRVDRKGNVVKYKI